MTSSDAKTMWTGSSDGKVLSWNLETAVSSQPDGETHPNYVAGLIAAPSHSKVYTVGWDDTLRIIDTSASTFSATAPVKLSGQPKGIAYNQKTERIDVISSQGIMVLDKAGSDKGIVPTNGFAAAAIAVSPDSVSSSSYHLAS